MSIKSNLYYSALFLFLNLRISALVPPLEREISLELHNEKVVVAFAKIKEIAQVNFSYPASLVATLAPVSINAQQKTVREVLSLLLPQHISIKQKNNYVLLNSRPIPQKTPEKKQISGYVVDEATKKKLPNVTVYDKVSLQSVTTDAYGYYELELPVATESISVNKFDYKDTVVPVTISEEVSILNLSIRQKPYLERLKDSLQVREKLDELNAFGKHVLSNFSGYINSLNVRDTLVRHMQVSFLPFVGTNHRMSGSVYNHVSFNVLGGYAKGLEGVEVGLLFNLERDNMSGFQVAGLINSVGDTVKGTQIAGLMNVCGIAASGLQIAGLLNVNGTTQNGIAISGLINTAPKHNGVGIAGLMNVTENLKGVQVAGLANVSDSAQGMQIAGLFNTAQHGKTMVQIAGLFNRSKKGSVALQVSSFYNRCNHLKGSQIGIINVADSASGVPIGLLSIVKQGVHQLEVSADEWFPLSIQYRTGVDKLYNVFGFGCRSSNNGLLWQLSYGMGSAVQLSKHWKFEFVASAAHVSQDEFYFAASDLYRIYLGAEFRPAKKFAIAMGPHLNYYVTDALTSKYDVTYRSIAPSLLWSSVSRYGFDRQVWLGAKIALRFF